MKKIRTNNRLAYFVTNIVGCLMPRFIFQKRLNGIIESYKKRHADEWDYIMDRVDYYCKLNGHHEITEDGVILKDFKHPKLRTPEEQKPFGTNTNSTYFFDTYKYTKYMPDDAVFRFVFGDTTFIPSCPAITKSRPVSEDNQNSVLLNLDKVRHFLFIEDEIAFEQKKDMLVGRAHVSQEHRRRFYEMYFDNPLCDLGQINTVPMYNEAWITPKLSLEGHLDYKFILCLRGNDVATSLKWVMSSNSIAVMNHSTYESWFMEGRLIPDYHYIEIKDDFSDLEEKLRYYIEHTDEALKIVENAHRYVEQFSNKKREDIISLLVVKKYMEMTSNR